MKVRIAQAAEVLLGGGVITCPTEGVFGFSCMPDEPAAIARILAIKRRDAGKGLILIAANQQQLASWIAIAPDDIPDPDPAQPTSWIVKAAPGASALVRGDHDSVAVRITTNPIARGICEAVDSPLISTSANVSGSPVARNEIALRRKFSGSVDYVVPGECGPASGPSVIRDLKTGKRLR